ncbi:flagellin [Chryseobacterium lathyri]|uniref:flagellin n=1 Tax=Chryseobacterium lathyri TaxID=395933 RepID=UPI001CBE97A0|nr:flagellin [Chryseobacterium lathyri]
MKTKTLLVTAAVAGALLTATSCSYFESGKNREKGTPVESSKTAVQKIIAAKEVNEGKRFSITGYLNYSAGMTVYVDRPQTVYVNTAPGDDGETITPVEMDWKQDGHNSVFVPEDTGRGSDKTIFYDNDGQPLTTNDKVEVSFEVGKSSIYPVEVRIDKVK